jgi:hypothetical protein
MLAEDLDVLYEGVPTRRHLAAAFWKSRRQWRYGYGNRGVSEWRLRDVAAVFDSAISRATWSDACD